MARFEDLVAQNPWWQDKKAIASDPRIKDFEDAKIKWLPRMRKYIDLEKDVLYSIRGPRQVGKTTLVKLMIQEELKSRSPSDVFYYSCDLVHNSQELYEIIGMFLDWSNRQGAGRKLVCLDEVTQVKAWEQAYKQVIDSRSINGTTYILTGSSTWDLKKGVERLPGRKGETAGKQNHKILLPMKFAEYACMRSDAIRKVTQEHGLDSNKERIDAFHSLMGKDANSRIDFLLPFQKGLEAILDEYLMTGGIMTATNQLVSKGLVPNTTYEMYLQLFFGDIARLSRNESAAKKILSGILKAGNQPTGWAHLSAENGIPTPVTAEQYVEILQSLFVINAYASFDQKTRMPKFRSNRKIEFVNPFFFHAFRGYLTNPAGDYFSMARAFLLDDINKAALSEAVVGDHLSRLAYNHKPSDMFDQCNSVFYVKNAQGETIDFAVRLPGGFVPVEVKYQNSIANSDYRNLRKFERGILVTKKTLSTGSNHPAIPLALFLMFI